MNMQFRDGDKVHLRKDLDIYSQYGNMYYFKGMDAYPEITLTPHEACYGCKENNYFYSEAMFIECIDKTENKIETLDKDTSIKTSIEWASVSSNEHDFDVDKMVETWLAPHEQRMNDGDGGGTHVITSLIEKSKTLPIYDYDLSYIDLSRDTWDYDSRESFIMHMKACNNADLNKPIIVAHNGQILDGMHRVCKAIELGMKTIPAVRFTERPTADYYS